MFNNIVVGLVFIFPPVLIGQDILLQVRVFQGTTIKGEPSIPADILLASSHPQIAALKGKVEGTESDLANATVAALLKSYDLQAIDQMFSFVLSWNGKDAVLSEGGISKHSAFRFEFEPKWHFERHLSIGFSLFKKKIGKEQKPGSTDENKVMAELKYSLHPSHYRERMEKLFNKEISIPLEDPAIVVVPDDGQVLFILLMAADRPQPIYQVLPAYPLELIQKGIQGQAIYRISIDEEGRVRNARVLKSLHPYLDSSVIQALQQWKFEPVVEDGKTVPVSFNWTISFNPDNWPKPTEIGSTQVERSSPELQRILDLSAEYCQKLGGAAMDFVCQETIKDTNYALEIPKSMKSDPPIRKIYPTGGSESISIRSVPEQLRPDPWKTKVNRYVCDYQMIKQNDRLEERRVLLKENGRSIESEKRQLEEKRITALKPLLASIKILSGDRQPFFLFKLLDIEKLRDRDAYVIEALPRTGAPGGVRKAKVWIDKSTFQILQSEIQGIPPEGYEAVLDEANQIGKELNFTMKASYSVEKNGVLFPSETEVLVEYPLNFWGIAKRTRMETEIRYDKYKFFTVKTESQIIK